MGELLFAVLAVPAAVVFGLVMIAGASVTLVGMVLRHICGMIFERQAARTDKAAPR